LDQKTNKPLNLDQLRARIGEKPRTKAGQIRQAWPEIRALFAAGHSLKDIWIWLNEIGIEIGYARLSHYTGQLKRRDQAASPSQRNGTGVEPGDVRNGISAVVQVRDGESAEPLQGAGEHAGDPLLNIRSHEDRRVGFQYNPEPDAKKLI
jgi:hypothetical protein